VGGGVQVSANEVIDVDNLLADEKGEVDAARKQVSLKDLPTDTWWWD
jgi:hypothetical protein